MLPYGITSSKWANIVNIVSLPGFSVVRTGSDFPELKIKHIPKSVATGVTLVPEHGLPSNLHLKMTKNIKKLISKVLNNKTKQNKGHLKMRILMNTHNIDALTS